MACLHDGSREDAALSAESWNADDCVECQETGETIHLRTDKFGAMHVEMPYLVYQRVAGPEIFEKTVLQIGVERAKILLANAAYENPQGAESRRLDKRAGNGSLMDRPL